VANAYPRDPVAFTEPAHRQVPRGGALGAALRDAARFERSAVSLTGGAIAAIPVIVVLAAGTAVSGAVAGVTMGAGAMLVGVAWRTGGGRPPLATMAAVSVLMALSTFVGAATGSVPWLHLALLVIWGYFGGLLVTLGRRTAVMGTQAIIAIVVFGRFSQPIPQAAGLAGLVLAGGAAQVAFAALVRWPPSLRVQRDSLVRAFRAVADLAVAPVGASSVPAAVAIDEAQATLAAPALLGDPAIMVLRSLVTEARRVRLELNAIRTLSQRPPGGAAPPESADLTDASDALNAIAAVIARPQGPLELGLLDQLPSMAARSGAGNDLEAELERRRAALGGQLRAVVALAEQALAQPERHYRPSRGATRPLQRARRELGELRANMSVQSPAGRHALRLAAVVPATELLAQHTPLARGYWMVVAAATVLRPEFGATFTRAAERLAGTALGVVIAGLVTAGLHPSGAVTVIVVGVLAGAAYTVFAASFAAGTAFLTATIVFLLNAVAPDTFTTATDRLIDTVIGGAIGLAAWSLWPTWSRGPARQALARLASAQRVYLRAVLAALIAREPANEDELRPLARDARLAWTNAQDTVARSLTEPTARQIDPDVSRGILAGLRRVVQAIAVVRVLDEGREGRAGGAGRGRDPALEALARAFDVGLAEIALVLDGGASGASRTFPPLRRRHEDLAAAAQAGGTPGPRLDFGEILLGELDEIVDALNTVGELVGLRPPER
jgi:uncharacterized membrane protein YccC